MRRNLTISFDSDFIDRMDQRRAATSRGLWLESLLSGKQVPLPESTRSPEPAPEIQPGKRANGHRDTCRCLSCARLTGTVD